MAEASEQYSMSPEWKANAVQSVEKFRHRTQGMRAVKPRSEGKQGNKPRWNKALSFIFRFIDYLFKGWYDMI